jgi:hypothetical protein
MPGKSVLASVIIEDCLRKQERNTPPICTTSYFYCSSNNTQTTSCIGVLRGLIAQLLLANPDLLVYCHEKFSKGGETLLTSMQTAKALFELLCDSTSRVSVIIDGLDECEKTERKALLEYLTSLVEKMHSASPGKMRLLVVSQQDGDIKALLSGAAVLTLSKELNGDDIRGYVHYRLNGLAEKFGLADNVKQNIVHMICAQASGKLHARATSYSAVC